MENFWHDLFPHSIKNGTWENESIDVVIKGCFIHYNTTACLGNSLLALLGISTLFVCGLRIARLHILHHPQIHQYLIFYFASLEILFLIVKWFVINKLYQMEFVASYLKMFQFILLCHFHWSLVSRILHQQKIITWIIIPLLGAFLSFFTSITALGLISNFSSWEDCLAPHWILLSFAEFLGIQMYVVAGFYITKKINSISAMDSFKWEQKRDLWSVIVTYEVSSATTLAYYITLRALGNLETGCSGIFNNAQDIYSPVYTTFMLIKYLLPIWVMLIIFYPTRGILSSEDERLLGWSGDGSTTSVFSQEVRFHESYKQLLLPVQTVVYFDPTPVLRRSASSPAIFTKPQLSPIWEERPILPPSRLGVTGYGAVDSFRSQPETTSRQPRKNRLRHDSGMPSRKPLHVSLNQASGDYESVTSSSDDRA